MLYPKHIQISSKPQGITTEQGLCYDNFSVSYNVANIMFTGEIEIKQTT